MYSWFYGRIIIELKLITAERQSFFAFFIVIDNFSDRLGRTVVFYS